MAENLGQAQLELTVDLGAFKKGLNDAQTLVRNTKAKYDIDTSAATVNLRRLEQSAKVLQAQFDRLKAPSLNLSSKKLPDDLRVVNTELLNFTRNVLNGKQALESNLAGLKQQGVAFATLAANVKIGTSEFRNFTQAAAQASQKQLFAGFDEIKALQQLFQGGGPGEFSSFKGTKDLLAFSSKVGNSTASIELYVRLLEQARSVTNVTDTNFAKLTAEIDRQTRSLLAAADAAEAYINNLRRPQLALPPAQGAAPFELQPPTQAELNAQARQQRRQAKIAGIQDYLSTGGRDTSVISGNQAIARPNQAAVAAEERLTKVREQGARAALKLADEELAAQKARRGQGFAQPGAPGPFGLLGQNIRQNGRSAIGNAVIGGAFPLLFGQGVGASFGGGIGGGLGGLAGGNFGFGLSLVGTALGAQVDAAVQKLGLLGSALDDPIGKFQELADAGLISSRALEKNIAALIGSGREAEAAARIQLDIAQQIGDTRELDEFADATGELQRSFASASTVAAKFVAGPLADFISKLALSFRLFGRRGVVNERFSQLGLSDAQRTSLVAEARNNVGGDPSKLYEEVNRLLDQRYSKTKQVLEAERLIADAVARQGALLSNSYAQVDAEAFGNRRLRLEKEIEAIELRRQESLAVGGLAEEAAARVNRDAALETYKVKQDIARLERDTWAQNIAAANQLRSIQEDIAIEQQRPNLTGTGVGALQAVKALEDAKRAEQDAQAALRAAPGDNSLINAAQLASEQVKLAAAKTKADLLDAYKAAEDSVRTIRRGIEDTVDQLQGLQNTRGSGLNEFLSPQAVSDRQAQLSAQLGPIAQQIAARRGIQFQFNGGTRESRNAALLRFIRADRQETRLQEDISRGFVDLGKAENDLAVVNSSLVTVNTQLTEATNNLASKDWNVNVAVNANTGDYAVQLG